MAGPFLRAEWPAPPGVVALTTLRSGPGVSEAPFDRFNLGNCSDANGDQPDRVARNRLLLQENAQLPAPPQWLRQVHGTGVLQIATASTDAPEADAAITREAGVVLAILTADCLPVLFCSDDGNELAAAHAGWRGLAAGMLEATVSAMVTPASQVLVWLGPAAGPQAYEIGEDVRAAFVEHSADAASAFRPTRSGHWHVDLYALARQRLAAAGVRRVFGGGLCTISDPRSFYSHRRDGRSGRMASLIWRQA